MCPFLVQWMQQDVFLVPLYLREQLPSPARVKSGVKYYKCSDILAKHKQILGWIRIWNFSLRLNQDPVPEFLEGRIRIGKTAKLPLTFQKLLLIHYLRFSTILLCSL